MNPAGIILTLLSAILVLAGSRRWAVLGTFIGVCYITQGQMITVAGFHFTAIRIVLLAGFIRILVRRETRTIQLNGLDWVVIGYSVVMYGLMAVRTGIWQESVGRIYDNLLSYFLFRSLVRNWEDVRQWAPDLALLILPLALLMIHNSFTGYNVFNAMGGRDTDQDWVREGRYRCVGSFRGPHSAGVLGATLLPLFVWLVFSNWKRGIAAVGIFAATAITYASTRQHGIDELFRRVGSLGALADAQRYENGSMGIGGGIGALVHIRKSSHLVHSFEDK
jgi:hypothetical protein